MPQSVWAHFCPCGAPRGGFRRLRFGYDAVSYTHLSITFCRRIITTKAAHSISGKNRASFTGLRNFIARSSVKLQIMMASGYNRPSPAVAAPSGEPVGRKISIITAKQLLYHERTVVGTRFCQMCIRDSRPAGRWILDQKNLRFPHSRINGDFFFCCIINAHGV